eukprot:1156598-Pelagomonas_calceolata.AAC.8
MFIGGLMPKSMLLPTVIRPGLEGFCCRHERGSTHVEKMCGTVVGDGWMLTPCSYPSDQLSTA